MTVKIVIVVLASWEEITLEANKFIGKYLKYSIVKLLFYTAVSVSRRNERVVKDG